MDTQNMHSIKVGVFLPAFLGIVSPRSKRQHPHHNCFDRRRLNPLRVLSPTVSLSLHCASHRGRTNWHRPQQQAELPLGASLIRSGPRSAEVNRLQWRSALLTSCRICPLLIQPRRHAMLAALQHASLTFHMPRPNISSSSDRPVDARL
jgi:hypothetical protein